MNDQIIIRGAREHNLRNVSLTVPRDKLVVFTGLSGSGLFTNGHCQAFLTVSFTQIVNRADTYTKQGTNLLRVLALMGKLQGSGPIQFTNGVFTFAE